VQVRGVDFTSAPSGREADLRRGLPSEGERLIFERLDRVASLDAFRGRAAAAGPWIAFDLPSRSPAPFLRTWLARDWPSYAG
jgi:hypothetical protein